MKLKRFSLMMGVLLAASIVLSACGGNGGNTKEPETQPQEIGYLIENGRTEYKVLLSASAGTVEETAAGEFVKYVRETTGVNLETVRDDTVSPLVSERYVSIGENRLEEKVKIAHDDLNGEGYVLKTVQDSLFIVGESEVGTLFGVYDWLERALGVKFLTTEYEYIPSLSQVVLYETDVTEVPAIASRSVYYEASAFDIYLPAKQRYSNYFAVDAGAVGGNYRDRWCWDMHSLGYIVPPAEYYDEHPDWFSQKENGVPCLSNGLNDDGTLDNTDSYIRAAIAAVQTYITENPKVEYVILGQPDNPNVCNCKKCTEQLGKLEESRSAQFMLWVNAVAREVQNWLSEEGIEREIKFARTAYQWTEAAPVKQDADGNFIPINEAVVPREDVYIIFIPATGCFIHTVYDENCSVNSMGVGAYYKQWQTICNRFAIFDYNINYFDYLSWYPNLAAMQRNLRYYRDTGVNGYIMEGALGAKNFYQQDMETWVLSKLMWNPDLELNSLISEFNRYYYGEEAGKIADDFVAYLQSHFYYQSVIQDKSGNGLHTNIYAGYCPWLVSAETMNEVFLDTAYSYVRRMKAVWEADGSLSQAKRADYLDHLEKFEVQIDYMKYRNYDAVFPADEEVKFAFMTEFFDKLKRNGIDRLQEGGVTAEELRKTLGY